MSDPAPLFPDAVPDLGPEWLPRERHSTLRRPASKNALARTKTKRANEATTALSKVARAKDPRMLNEHGNIIGGHPFGFRFHRTARIDSELAS